MAEQLRATGFYDQNTHADTLCQKDRDEMFVNGSGHLIIIGLFEW